MYQNKSYNKVSDVQMAFLFLQMINECWEFYYLNGHHFKGFVVKMKMISNEYYLKYKFLDELSTLKIYMEVGFLQHIGKKPHGKKLHKPIIYHNLTQNQPSLPIYIQCALHFFS